MPLYLAAVLLPSGQSRNSDEASHQAVHSVQALIVGIIRYLEDLKDEPYEDHEHLPRVHNEMNAQADVARKRLLTPPKKLLHLALIANDKESVPSDGRKAGASDVIRPMLEMATSRGWPVVLEATSPRSRDIYARLGFKVAGELKLGAGRINSKGRREEGGEGVSQWAMVYGS